MKKQQKRLILLLLVLALLAAAFLGLRYYNRLQEKRDQEPQGETVLSIEDGLLRIAYDLEGKQYEYDKIDDTWYYTPDHSLTLFQYRLQHIEEKCRLLTATTVIPDVTDMSQYGLAEGYQTVTLETETESYTLWIGNENEITGDCYVCRPSDNTVYAVDYTFAAAFDLDVENIIDENASQDGTEGTEETPAEQEASGTEETLAE